MAEEDVDLENTSNNVVSRKKFAPADDVVLLRVVNSMRPWQAPIGTSNGIMKMFADIADACKQDPKFRVEKTGTALRTRFLSLVNQYKIDQCRSLRQSGTVEDYKEREILLQDIVTQMDDWQEKRNEEKELVKSKQSGIESSGEVMRRLAMDEYNDDDEYSSPRDSSIELDRTPTNVEPVQLDRTPTSLETVRGRSTKVSKRERLGAVTDSLVQAIQSCSDNQEKYAYKRQRLEFEQQQADKQREHERVEAELRRAHELNMEKRREEAERKRDENMHNFLLAILKHKSE
jgi:hypothetical protein